MTGVGGGGGGGCGVKLTPEKTTFKKSSIIRVKEIY